MLAGLLLAVLASLMFNTAILLQAIEARRVPLEHGLRVSLLGRLMRSRRWLAGVALSVAAAGTQVAALTLAPLAVVQPADAAGLVALLVMGSRVLGERIGARELTAVTGIVAGITVVAAVAPSRSVAHPDAAGLAEGLLIVGALGAAPYALRRRAGTQGLVVVLGAGFAFAAAAFSVKLVADSLSSGAWFSLALVAATAVAAGAAGTLSEQTALQCRRVTQVAPIIFVTELLVPLALAMTVGGETVGGAPLAIAAMGIGLSLLILSVITLIDTPAVSGLLSADRQAQHAEGSSLRPARAVAVT